MTVARVFDGDCLVVMPTLDAESVDAIVTDPPYGLEFMGKAWDTFKPTHKQPKIGEGDGSPHRRNRGTPAFTAAGNPTCKNCGGDKYRNGDRKCKCDSPNFGNPNGVQMLAFQEFMTLWAIEALRVAKPGAHLVAFGGTRTYHRLTCAIEDAGWEIRDCLSWLYGSGFPKSHNGPWGGTALKPGWEPIVLARKPLAGTVEGNHAKHGTGALNIDGCRLLALTPDEVARSGKSGGIFSREGSAGIDWKRDGGNDKGRWPANVVLDEVAAGMLDEQSGTLHSGFAHTLKRGETTGKGMGYGSSAIGHAVDATYGDSGGASRFFYTAKASRSERNAGLGEHRPLTTHGATMRDMQVAPKNGNHHPTVKPLELMQWLCRLVTPKGGLILDPFTGSGSTGRAAIAEGFSFIGIELEPEYAAIARARIAEYAPLFTDGAA